MNNNNNMNPFASLPYSSDPILQQYYLTVQQSLLTKSLEGDTSTTSSSTRIKNNRVVKMTSSLSSSSSAVPGDTGTYGFANVTPIPSSASSVTSSSGTASGSGSESDVSSLAAAAAANARAQAAAMAVAAQVGAPVSATAAMFAGNPQALAAMTMAQNGGSGIGIGAAPANMNMYSAQAQAQAQAAGYGAQAMIATPHHPIPEFLYQLTKMLTDDNSAYIEWKEGRIFVHDPPALADNVLHRYFRHSKYASFQRQLNYFGFKKLAGKGKMSPCSYINENATDDIRSLLFIKRKTNGPKAPQAKKTGAVGTENGKPSAGGRKRKAAASKKAQARVIPSGQPASKFVAPGANHPYETALAQQQALLAAQQQQSSSSAGPSTNNPGVTFNASASTNTSETFHFPTDQALQQLQQQQQQQLQMLQEQKQFQEQQLQHQRQQLEFLQGQRSQQNQQQQATAGNGETSASMPCPATMAMNAASAANALAGGNDGGPTTGGGNSLFGSSSNLASLLKTDTTAADPGNGAAQVGSNMAPLSAATSSAFLSSLPSSNTLFPDSISTLSLNRLLNGATPAPGGLAGGMPSMLGLNGFLSRESSLLNLAMGLPANLSSQALQAMGASAPTASESNAFPEGSDAAAKIMG